MKPAIIRKTDSRSFHRNGRYEVPKGQPETDGYEGRMGSDQRVWINEQQRALRLKNWRSIEQVRR